MASLDSAKGPSATVRSFPETIFPSRSSGWALLTFPCRVRRSNQLFHWPMIFWISSGDRPLSHCAPRNNSRYSDFVICVFILSFLVIVLFQFKYKTNKQPLSGHFAAIFRGRCQVFARRACYLKFFAL